MIWPRLPIKRIADVFLGKMIQPEPRSESDVAAPYLRAAHVQPNGHIIDVDDKTMWFRDGELALHDLRRDDVVIVEGGAGYGRSAVIRDDRDGWGFQNSIVRVRPQPALARGRYLDYALQSALAAGEVEVACFTATIPHFTADKVGAFWVPAPPIGAQRAIADYLDRETARIDTLIEEQQRLIEMSGERRAAVVDAALAPSSSWTRTTLKHMLSGVDQGVSPQAEGGLADEPGTWGVLKAGCVNRGVFRPEEHKRLPSDFAFDPAIAVEVGDVIVSRASGSPNLVGSAAIVEHLDHQLILSDKLFRLRPKRLVDPRFLAWGLNSGQYRVQVRRAISGAEGLANNLPLSKLRAFEMHHPSMEEQRRIAAYLDQQTAKIDALIEETERFIDLSRERRAALITAAVTGQIDVREMA